MPAARRIKPHYRSWLLPLLLAPFLGATLPGCFRCEAVTPPPVIPTLFFASGRVYLFSPSITSFYALRASDGKELWHTQGIFQAGDANQIYLSPNQQNYILEALRASDGKVIWQSRQAVPFRTLGALDGSVYLYEFADNALVALQAADGSQRWKVESAHLDSGSDGPGNLSMQVANGVVYTRSMLGVVSAFREKDGALLWSHNLPGPFDNRSPWVVGPGAVYLSATGGLYALRASDGKTLWHGNPASIALDPGGSILYALSNQRLAALRTSDGHTLWTHTEPDLQASPRPLALKLIDGTLYAGNLSITYLPDERWSTDYYQAVDALRASDGQPLWQYQGKEGIIAVAGANGTAYLFDYGMNSQTGAVLAALHASDGHPLWQHDIKQAAGMAFADGALYTGYGGNDQTSGCIANGPVVVAKFSPIDGSQLWRFES